VPTTEICSIFLLTALSFFWLDDSSACKPSDVATARAMRVLGKILVFNVSIPYISKDYAPMVIVFIRVVITFCVIIFCQVKEVKWSGSEGLSLSGHKVNFYYCSS